MVWANTHLNMSNIKNEKETLLAPQHKKGPRGLGDHVHFLLIDLFHGEQEQLLFPFKLIDQYKMFRYISL